VASVAIQAVIVLGLLEAGLWLLRDRGTALDVLLYLPAERTEFDDVATTEALLRRTPLGFRPGYRAFGFVRNPRGFATGDYTVAPGPRERRVLVIGDSFVYNDFPVRWMWPAQLERELHSRLIDEQVDPRVFALGMPGIGPAAYLRLWELEGPLVGADHVVVGFFVGNDLAGLDQEMAALADTRPSWLVRRSLVARTVRNLTRVARNRAAGGAGLDTSADGGGTGTVNGRDRGGYEIASYREGFDADTPTIAPEFYWALKGVVADLLLLEHEARHRRAVERAGSILDRLARSVRRSGAHLVVVLIPDELQVHDQLLEETLRRQGVEQGAVEVGLPQRLLVAELEGRGIEHLDLLSYLRARSASPLYRPRDTHLNRRGNRLAARALADRLMDDLRPSSESRRPDP
jgi:hypothetical protein